MDHGGGQVGAIRDDKRDHDLELRLTHETEKKHPDGSHSKANRRPCARYQQEAPARIQRRWMAAHDASQDGGENRKAGAVVEEALALEDRLQPGRSTNL